MIQKTIPKSVRAGVALFAAIVCVSTGLNGLQALVVPGEDSAWTMIKTLGGLGLGAVATIVFYYFQAADGDPKPYSELDTLSNYYQSEREKQKYKEVEVTPAYEEKTEKQIKIHS